jgi:hypothetical protein
MTNLLTYAYWFSFLPVPFVSWVLKLLIAKFAGLVLIGIVLRVLAAKKSDSMYWAKGGLRLSRLAIWMGCTGLILVWLTTEQVYFFGARFWFLVWGAVFVLWLVSALKYLLKVIPKQAAEFAEKARIGKYLPKSN